MGDSSLSQDEIDALLSGADDAADMGGFGATSSANQDSGSGSLSPSEEDALGDLLGSAFNTAGSSISAMLENREVSVNFLQAEFKNSDELAADFSGSFVSVAIDFTGDIFGNNLFIFHQRDAIAIASILMGGDGNNLPDEMDDGLLQTFQEPMNIFVSSMATQLGNKISKSIQTGPPEAKIFQNLSEVTLPSGDKLTKVTYNISISDLINSQFYQVMDYNMSKTMATMALGRELPSAPSEEQSQSASRQVQQPTGSVNINPVKFPAFNQVPAYTGQGNIDLLMDVPMTLTVELGRAKMMIKDILSLGEGSIIELDKLAGEPVDLLVNGKLIGKGEVVVIDENFGVRVTDIVSPMERLKQFSG